MSKQPREHEKLGDKIREANERHQAFLKAIGEDAYERSAKQ